MLCVSPNAGSFAKSLPADSHDNHLYGVIQDFEGSDKASLGSIGQCTSSLLDLAVLQDQIA